jgi:serine/threonine protein kinase
MYAAKVINVVPSDEELLRKETESMCREIDTMRKLNHVQVVALLDMFRDEQNRPCLIMDMYDSSLESYLNP